MSKTPADEKDTSGTGRQKTEKINLSVSCTFVAVMCTMPQANQWKSQLLSAKRDVPSLPVSLQPKQVPAFERRTHACHCLFWNRRKQQNDGMQLKGRQLMAIRQNQAWAWDKLILMMLTFKILKHYQKRYTDALRFLVKTLPLSLYRTCHEDGTWLPVYCTNFADLSK